MARPVPIGEYESQVPVQEGLRRIIPQVPQTSLGPAIEDVGGALQTVARSEAAQYTLQAMSNAQREWTQNLTDRQLSAAPGAPGFTPALLKDYDTYVKAAVKGAPNALAARFLNQQLTSFGNQLSQKALSFEVNARQTHYENTAKESIDSASTELQQDPTKYAQRLAERQSLINSMGLEPQVKEQLNRYAQTSMAKFAVMGDIDRDPYQAMLSLQKQDGYYGHITAEQREQLLDHADRMLHQRVADAERVHNLAKQQEQETSDNLLKQGIVMAQGGQLTPQWVTGHVNTLRPEALKYLLDETSGKKVDSDLHVYAGLLTKAGEGQDVRDDAQEALFNGLLSKEDFTRITDKAAAEVPNAYKRGLQYIQTAGKTSELEPDPAKTQTLANMQNDFQDWFKTHPTASDKESQDQAIDIVRRYQLVRADQNLLTLPVPHYFVGTRANPDLRASKQALWDATQRGEIGQDEAKRQLLLLNQWQDALTATQQRAAAAKAKQQQ